MRSGNPALSEKAFKEAFPARADEGVMTIEGTVNKTAILFIVLMIGASIGWYQPIETAAPLLWTGLIGGLVLALVTIFKKEWAKFTAPPYAFFEGLFLGAVSMMYASLYEGIVLNAIMLTLGTFAAMLAVYRSGLINVTQRFRLGVVAATGGIMLVYFATWILGFFGINVSLVTGTGLIGIGFSLFIIVIAALNLILDFDLIEQGAANDAPKFFEWYSAFGLLVTLIWLYLEFLRLLAKLQRR